MAARLLRRKTVERAILAAQKTAISSLADAGPEGEVLQFSRSLVWSLLCAIACEDRGVACGAPVLECLSSTEANPYDTCLAPKFRYYDTLFHTTLFCAPLRLQVSPLPAQLLPVFERMRACCGETDLFTLGNVYERLLHPGNAKKDGIFYTPHSVVATIVSKTLGPNLSRRPPSDSPALRILDPACGSGIFLLEAAQVLFDHWQETASQDSSLKSSIAQQCLYGVDKDPAAVDVCRLCLALWCLENSQGDLFQTAKIPNLRPSIQTGNSLLEPEDFDLTDPDQMRLSRDLQSFSWKESFPAVFDHGGFDCIVGNPPYGLSRAEQLSAPENEKLKQVYAPYRTGKINKYLAFMAKSLTLLHQSGSLSFIVPNAWLGIRGGAAMRRLLLEERLLQSVSVYHSPLFDDISVEPVIFIIDKSRRNSKVAIRHFQSIENRSPGRTFEISAASCLKIPDAMIPTMWTEEVAKIFDQIQSLSDPLGNPDSPFIPRIALQAYASGKGSPPQTQQDVKSHVFDRREKENEQCLPYLQGSDITRFNINWSGGYLFYGKWLAEPQSLDRFDGPRIILREIVRPAPYMFVAAFTQEPFLYNKSVLHILPASGSSEELMWALLTILNSKLASFVLKFQGKKTQRKLFPKIVNDDLKNFPLARAFFDSIETLAPLAREMHSLIAELPAPEKMLLNKVGRVSACENESGGMKGIAELQDNIDDKVYRLYALSDSTRQVLEERLSETGAAL